MLKKLKSWSLNLSQRNLKVFEDKIMVKDYIIPQKV